MKYSLTDEKIETKFGTLRRIRAEIDFGEIKSGDLGGFIFSERNLSQSGDAWVYGDAQVSGNAQVYGNARVYGDARVSGDAWVSFDTSEIQKLNI